MLSLPLAWRAGERGRPSRRRACRPRAAARLDVRLHASPSGRIPFGSTSFDDPRSDNAAYQTNSHFETSGIVSTFWQAHHRRAAPRARSRRAASLRPRTIPSTAAAPPSTSGCKLTYAADGMPVTFADPPYNTQKYPVTDDEKKAGLDPLERRHVVPGRDACERQQTHAAPPRRCSTAGGVTTSNSPFCATNR